MHFLDRTSVPAPTSLSRYRHGSDKWDKLSTNKVDYQEVTDALNILQGTRCAYCECALGPAHVDHFDQQARAPQRTFAWDNLFRSCERQDSCGRHKDRQNYEAPDLIKPDVDDPERFFQFETEGTISVRKELSSADTRRAETTLRVLALDAARGPLRAIRKSHVAGYVQSGIELLELAAACGEDAHALIDEAVAQTAHLPYATAIKHVLTLRER